jgi:hypothetical protein
MAMRFGRKDRSIYQVNISEGFKFSQTCKEAVSRFANKLHNLLKVLRQ